MANKLYFIERMTFKPVVVQWLQQQSEQKCYI